MRSATVNVNVRFDSLGVLSGLCLVDGVTPDECVFSDEADLKIDGASHAHRLTDSSTGGARVGKPDDFCVKLLRLHSRYERKLVAIKQVSKIALQVTNRYRQFSRGFITSQRGGNGFHTRIWSLSSEFRISHFGEEPASAL